MQTYYFIIAEHILGLITGALENSFYSVANTTNILIVIIYFLLLSLEISIEKSKEGSVLPRQKSKKMILERNFKEEANQIKLLQRVINDLSALNELLFECTKHSAWKRINPSTSGYTLLVNCICAKLYALTTSLFANKRDISITYVEKVTEINTTYFTMKSFIGATNPKMYSRHFSEFDAQKHYFGKIFAANSPDTLYLLDANEIAINFFFQSMYAINKYSQYIGIPIYCESEGVFGLLQITTLNGAHISIKQEELEHLINAYIMPYVNMLKLAHGYKKQIAKKDIYFSL